MALFLIRRLIQAAVIIFVVVSMTFFMVRLAPGDPFANDSARPLPQDFLEAHRETWGLNDPLLTQYGLFLKNTIRGDFGRSFYDRQPVTTKLSGAIFNTLLLASAAIVINFAIGIMVGMMQARKRGHRFDQITTLLNLVLLSFPIFWLGLLATHVFGNVLGIFPGYGVTDPVSAANLTLIGKFFDRVYHLVLPASVLGLAGAAYTARYMRTQAIEVSQLPHVNTARAKGLSERTVFVRHVARNAMIPMVTLFGLYFPALLSGAVFVEWVFGWHGLGWQAATAVTNSDYPVMVAITAITSMFVIVGNIVADLLYRWADPRAESA